MKREDYTLKYADKGQKNLRKYQRIKINRIKRRKNKVINEQSN